MRRTILLAVVALFVFGVVLWADSLRVAWDAPTVPVAGYRVLWGTAPGQYQTTVDVGSVSETVVSGLPAQRTYLVVKAYDVAGLLSDASNEVSAVPVPGQTPTPTPAPTPSPTQASQNCTRITPGAGTITTADGATWSLGSNLATLRNGVHVGGGYAAAMVITNGQIQVLGIGIVRVWHVWSPLPFPSWPQTGVGDPCLVMPTPAPTPNPTPNPCDTPLGSLAISVFGLQKMGSRARLDFEVVSSSPVTRIAVRGNGADLAVIDGVNLSAIGALRYPAQGGPTPYALSVSATNAAGCSREQSW